MNSPQKTYAKLIMDDVSRKSRELQSREFISRSRKVYVTTDCWQAYMYKKLIIVFPLVFRICLERLNVTNAFVKVITLELIICDVTVSHDLIFTDRLNFLREY